MIFTWLAAKVESQGRKATVLPAKGDSDVMFCLHSYQDFMITDR